MAPLISRADDPKRSPDPMSTARVVYSTDASERIPDLLLDAHDYPVKDEGGGKRSIRVRARIQGKFSYHLVADGKAVEVERYGEDPESVKSFELTVPIGGEVTYVRLSAMNRNGDVKEEKWKVLYPGWFKVAH